MSASEMQVRKDSRMFAELSAALLERGHSVQFRVHGESMRPNLGEDDTVVVAPVALSDLQTGDLALVQNDDGLLLHRVCSVNPSAGALHTVSDTALEPDLPASRMFGKVTVRQRGSRAEVVTPFQTRFLDPLRIAARRIRLAVQHRLRRAWSFLFAIAALLLLCATFLAPAAKAQADLKLTQTVSVSAIAVSTSYTYTHTVTNNGPSAVATGTIIVYQQTPPNTNFRSYVGTNWNCTNPGSGNAGPIICTYNAALANGASASALTITMQVNAGTASGTTIQNSATVTSGTVSFSIINTITLERAPPLRFRNSISSLPFSDHSYMVPHMLPI